MCMHIIQKLRDRLARQERPEATTPSRADTYSTIDEDLAVEQIVYNS